MERLRPFAPAGGRRALILAAVFTTLLLPSQSCNRQPAPTQQQSSAPQNVSPPPAGQPPVPGVALQEDGQWVMPAKDYASTRFSGLDQINTGNVANLKVAWTFSTGVNRGQEAAPLVVGDTMYVVTPYPNILYALDLKNPGSVKWKYEPAPMAAAQGVACCDLVNRGAAFSDGKIIYNTLDAQTVAVDAANGKEVWRTKLGDINKGETITMAPLVAHGKVIVGNSGGEFGVRGWVAALNVSDGKEAWRAYSTGPDRDVLIGAGFKPFYPKDQGTDLGTSTWPPDAWKTGGGTMWGWVTYDPGLDLIYHGTGNAGPWNPDQRPGDNKWSCTVFARRAETGAAVWAYQTGPHDLYDWDDINEQLLLDMNLNGQARKVLVRPARNGYVYVMDRTTGEILSANPFAHQTATKGVDLKTGELVHVEEKKPVQGKVIRDICPAAPGGKDWNPSAYSPRTGLLYIPHNNLCMDFEGLEVNYIAGTPYVGANVKMYAGPGGHRGEFTAWDVAAGRPVWRLTERFPVWSGAVATAGDVVFYGTMDGYFKAIDARTGNLLWQFKVGSGIIGQPVVYRGPDGKQYVAVLSGVGGWAGAVVAGGLDPRDQSAALGFAGATGDLPQYTTKGGTLYVFSLP
jgi:PQQ-dependent dehydrogenase (methanol/ethanol family)